MTGKQIEKYIKKELGFEPRHNCEALAEAINHIAAEVEYDSFCGDGIHILLHQYLLRWGLGKSPRC